MLNEFNSQKFHITLVYSRSRLKKDYDDFRRQPDHGQFTRELWTTEESEGHPEREAPKAELSKSVDAAEPLDSLDKEREDSGGHLSLLNIKRICWVL